MSKSISQHANMMVIENSGVLIIGAPNVGKSEISLALIDRGHQFVSDDATELRKENNTIIGSCPKVSSYFMQVDYVGLINIEKLFGPTRCLQQHRVDLCIELKSDVAANPLKQPLEPIVSKRNILGINIPCYQLIITVAKQLPLLIEMIIKNFNTEKTGYNALKDLQQKQHAELNRNHHAKNNTNDHQ